MRFRFPKHSVFKVQQLDVMFQRLHIKYKYHLFRALWLNVLKSFLTSTRVKMNRTQSAWSLSAEQGQKLVQLPSYNPTSLGAAWTFPVAPLTKHSLKWTARPYNNQTIRHRKKNILNFKSNAKSTTGSVPQKQLMTKMIMRSILLNSLRFCSVCQKYC